MAVPVLEGAAGILSTIGALPGLTGVAGVVLAGLAGAANLIAKLLRHGIHPDEAIAVWASALPDVAAANDRIDDLIKQRSGQ